jgi:hypothetical protein
MARRRGQYTTRRGSYKGEYINGKFVTYKELARSIDIGYENYLKKRIRVEPVSPESNVREQA